MIETYTVLFDNAAASGTRSFTVLEDSLLVGIYAVAAAGGNVAIGSDPSLNAGSVGTARTVYGTQVVLRAGNFTTFMTLSDFYPKGKVLYVNFPASQITVICVFEKIGDTIDIDGKLFARAQ